MELKEFIKQTLNSVIGAVEECQSESGKAIINPLIDGQGVIGDEDYTTIRQYLK